MKKIRLVLLLLTFTLCLSACGNKKGSNKNDNVTNADESVHVSYPLTVTDQSGRTVTFDEEPQKIVSGYYISTSLLIALELDDKMVGIEAKANKRPLYKLSAENIINLPSVGSAKEFDLEGCIALEPDLVILPIKLKEAAASLENLGINVILVNPESEELLTEMVDIISTVTNTKERAEELNSFIEEKKQLLETATKSIQPKSVYLAGNSGFLSTAGSNMYQSDMITMAGGKNVADSIKDSYWSEVSYEQVLAWNPEYIIIAADATYTVEDVLKNQAISSCDAVKNGRVYKFPSDVEAWDSPVPSGILGSVWLTSILNPEALSAEERESIIEEYYEKFYDFKYSQK